MLRDSSSGLTLVTIATSLLLTRCAPEAPRGTPRELAVAAPARALPALIRDRRALVLKKLSAARYDGALDSHVREPVRSRALPVPARQPTAQLHDVPERFRATAAAIDAERIAQGIPGLAIAIVERGKLSFAHGFGSKDPDGVDPVRASTLFRLASNTKPFTAVSVLQQVECGALDIDDTLRGHVPTFALDVTPEQVPAITLRQLLSHSSGLGDYLDIDVPEEQKTDAALSDFLLGAYRSLGYLQSPPGALFSYSNVGYSLLGLVAQIESSVPFRTLVKERVWAPLGMERTFFEPTPVLADGDFALGICRPDAPECAGEGLGSVFAPDTYDAPSSAPAAASWSSVLDLAKWARFLVHGNPAVLSDALRARMAEPQISTHLAGDILSYGLGLQLQSLLVAQPDPAGPIQIYDAPQIAHGGSLPGFRSLVSCVPSLDFCFIGLANYDGVDFSSMERAALRLATLPEPIQLPDIAPRPERFPEYVGDYLDPNTFGPLIISLDAEGSLHLEAPVLDQFEVPYGHDLTPNNVDTFTFDLNGMIWPLTFLTGASSSYDYLRVLDRFVATRVDDANLPSVSATPFEAADPGTRLRDAIERPVF
jgi:CubicO group peptidase (beta-lactamase class C family)